VKAMDGVRIDKVELRRFQNLQDAPQDGPRNGSGV